MTKQIPKLKDETLTLPPINTNSFYLIPAHKEEVKQTIKELKKKSGGIDGINTRVIKTLQNIISEPLANIFNNCIQKGIWPNALKTAEIVPIHKGKEKFLANNYRPISLISNIAKIYERLLHKRMLKFLDKHEILSQNQYGFRKNRSTKDALNLITNIIYNELDSSKPLVITFLDLAKAFDTVDHQILLQKAERYGIRGVAQNLLRRYLENRQQRVKINNVKSNFKIVKTGVPQGTILGPLLFIMYINDMLNIFPKHSIISYADDTVIIAKGITWTETEENMNMKLNKIAKWLALNKLSLNTDKTVYLEFGNNINSTPKTLDIKIQDKPIQRTENVRYLGVTINSNMRWEAHITNIYNKTKYLLFTFYKLSKIFTHEILNMLYYAFFHSVVYYGIIAWGGAYTNKTRPLQTLQNRITKIINKNKFPKSNRPLNLEQTFTL